MRWRNEGLYLEIEKQYCQSAYYNDTYSVGSYAAMFVQQLTANAAAAVAADVQLEFDWCDAVHAGILAARLLPVL